MYVQVAEAGVSVWVLRQFQFNIIAKIEDTDHRISWQKVQTMPLQAWSALFAKVFCGISSGSSLFAKVPCLEVFIIKTFFAPQIYIIIFPGLS